MAVLTRIQWMSQRRNYTNFKVGVPPWLNPSVLQLLDCARLPALRACLNKQSLYPCLIEREMTKGKALGGGRYRCFISRGGCVLASYAPMIYTTQCVMFLMRADLLWGQVGGGWVWKSRFFGPCEMTSSREASAIWGPKTLDLTGCKGCILGRFQGPCHPSSAVK